MKSHERYHEILKRGSTIGVIESNHRSWLKDQLLDQATFEREKDMMGQFKRVIALATFAALMVGGAMGATIGTYFLNIGTGRPEITAQGPVEAVRAVYGALQTGRFDSLETLFPSREQLASAFSEDHPFVARYDELKAKLQQEFERCRGDYPSLTGAELVRVDGDYGILANQNGGEAIEVYDNAHFFVLVGGTLYDIRLDELFKIDGEWYVVELPGKQGAESPRAIEQP